MYNVKPLIVALFLFAACDASQDGELGRLNFNDTESLSAPGSGSFAVGDEIVLAVVQIAGLPVSLRSLVLGSSDPAILAFSAPPELASDGSVILRGEAVGEGSAAVLLSDPVTGTLLDRITLQTKVANGLALDRASLFEQGTLPDETSFFVLEDSNVVLGSRLLSVLGGLTVGLKGQIPGVAAVDSQFASVSADGPLRLGGPMTIAGHALGVTPITFSGAAFSQTFDAKLIDPNTVTLIVTPDLDGAGPISSGSLLADAVFLDGSGSLVGEEYRFQEKGCIVNLAGSCHVEFDTLGNFSTFQAVRSGTVTLEVSLKASNGQALQSVEFTVEVFAE